jgi:glycosyltransferase involved in cell wall biosynthesis
VSDFYVVREKINPTPGGVDLEPMAIFKIGESLGIKVLFIDLLELSTKPVAGDFVFLQQEGLLSPEFKFLATKALDNGVTIIEKNVFALASSHRPIHQNYYMALMSEDGAFRYSLRSAFSLNKSQANYLLVPNPNLKIDLDDNELTLSKMGNVINLLRVGRPSMLKWTDFEIEFAYRLARQLPFLEVNLHLVGAPKFKNLKNQTNLKIFLHEYTSDVHQFYSESDVYIHHSRIGETFGNTIFEAASFGLPIVCAYDIAWDCAPIEYLSDSAFHKAPSSILKDPVGAIVSSIILKNTNPSNYSFHEGRIAITELLKFNLSGLSHMTPKPWMALKYLFALNRSLDASRLSFLKAISREFLRALRKELLK